MSKNDWIKKLEPKRGRDSLICVFCNSDVEDECQYGKLYCKGKITVHYFCLLLATKLDQKGSDHEGILGFMPKDIEKQLNGAKDVRCCYCSKGGATVYCCGKSCEKVFHLPCGLKEQSFHEFYGRFRSFCRNHRKIQMIDQAILIEGAKTTQICTICYDTVVPEASPNTVWAPCCKRNAWFHKACVQNLALNAGYFFKCPLCNNKRLFHSIMKKNGIFIPEQDASWERVPHAFDDMYTTYQRCDAVKCCCKKGRSYSERRTVFTIVLCKYCGSQGVHKKCGGLRVKDKEWACSFCTNALSSGHTITSTTTEVITFNVQDFFSSSVSRRFFPQVNVERKFAVPPSIRIGEASLEILKGSYRPHKTSIEPTTTSETQVLQHDVNCLQPTTDLSAPESSLWEQEEAHSCAPNDTDNCKENLIDECKINGFCMKENISSVPQCDSATETICYLKGGNDGCDLKHTQDTQNPTGLLRDTETPAMSCHNNVNGLSDSNKEHNTHQSFFQTGQAMFLGSDSEGYQTSTTCVVPTADVSSPESKRIKSEKICHPDSLTRELKFLGVKSTRIFPSRMSFTRSRISYLPNGEGQNCVSRSRRRSHDPWHPW